MQRFSIAILLLCATACSPDSTDKVGYIVNSDDACHRLLLAQCGCCENGEPNCTAGITAGITSGQLKTNMPLELCEKNLADAETNAQAFCDRFSTDDAITLACYGFPPKETDKSQ